jgi:hypothetical protein
VHEAYLRLVDANSVQNWNSRGHFFAAAAEAMRRVLIEQARRKCSQRRGGTRQRCELLDGDRLDTSRHETFTAVGDGVPLVDDPNNQAGQFNGSNAFVIAPDLATKGFTSEATLLAWVRFDQLPSQVGHTTDILTKSGFARDLDLQAETDNRFHFYAATGDAYQVVSNTLIQAQQWYFLAATYKAEDMIQIYVNGALENTTFIPDVIRLENSNAVVIGASAFWPGRFFPGAIGEAAIFDKALTVAEVDNLYQSATMGGGRGGGGSRPGTATGAHAAGLADAAVLVGLASKSAPPGGWDASGMTSAPSDDRPVKSVASVPAVSTIAADSGTAAAIPGVPGSPARTHAAADTLFGAWPTEISSIEPLAWLGGL